MRWLVGILLAIFLVPVCLIAGAFGGCLVGALTSAVDPPGVGLTVSMVAGILIGIGSGVALTVLAVRNIGSHQQYRP